MSDCGITIDVISPEVNLTLDLNSFYVPSSGGGTAFVYTQSSVANIWTINHNLGFKPIVQVYNSGSQLILASVSHTSNNQTVINLTTPISGYARLI